MASNYFPNIKGALRGKLVKEEDVVPPGQQPPDPMNDMDPQQRINYLNEVKRLDDQEAKLRLEIDKVRKSKDDLKKKYHLPA